MDENTTTILPAQASMPITEGALQNPQIRLVEKQAFIGGGEPHAGAWFPASRRRRYLFVTIFTLRRFSVPILFH
jgi:hypothetical protein